MNDHEKEIVRKALLKALEDLNSLSFSSHFNGDHESHLTFSKAEDFLDLDSYDEVTDVNGVMYAMVPVIEHRLTAKERVFGVNVDDSYREIWSSIPVYEEASPPQLDWDCRDCGADERDVSEFPVQCPACGCKNT